MSILAQSASFSSKIKTTVTVGTFDGVHLGHQKIISKLVETAKANGSAPTLLTFDPHPRKVVQPNSSVDLIQTLEERAETLAHLGLKHMVVHPFTKAFSQLSAAEYVKEFLVEMLNIDQIIIGYNHRFGKNRTASVEDLKRFGEIYDFKVMQISAEEIDTISISSTKIRAALAEGDVVTAHTFLGHPFTLSGTVVKGEQRGRTIGFPTANIAVNHPDKIIPKNGVYAVRVQLQNKERLGMMNIGTNPTVNGENRSIEVHIFDWSASIYNQPIQVSLIERIRDELKFDSLETLQKQLEKDKAVILTAYNTLPL
ncbi:MAG: Riboflavin biosynthesis protein RibF [Bacteroidota bacterium]|nr:MAG: Riboflavin biosynthesis protein RibF [Bacteroidota bacterium]